MAVERIGINPGIITAKLQQDDNTRTGATSIAEYEGSYAQCVAHKAYLQFLGATETSLQEKGNGYWIIRGNFPFGFNGQVTDFSNLPSVHELDTNVAQVSVYRSRKLRTLLSASELGIVAKVVADYQAGQYPRADSAATAFDDAVDDLQTQIDDGADHAAGRSSAQAQSDGEHLFTAVACMGVDDFIEYYSVYRRTLTAATPDQVRASYEGVGKIWTTAEVQAWENIAPGGWFILDAASQWLKSRPIVQGVAGQKTQVVYTYTECATALGLVYDPYNSATLLYPPAA